MGEVFRARDTRLERDLAVKVIHQRLGAEPDRLARFEKEARAAARLDHRNILIIHDVGTHDGQRASQGRPIGAGDILQQITRRAPRARDDRQRFTLQALHHGNCLAKSNG
jgi:serine/threonine protein kinase